MNYSGQAVLRRIPAVLGALVGGAVLTFSPLSDVAHTIMVEANTKETLDFGFTYPVRGTERSTVDDVPPLVREIVPPSTEPDVAVPQRVTPHAAKARWVRVVLNRHSGKAGDTGKSGLSENSGNAGSSDKRHGGRTSADRKHRERGEHGQHEKKHRGHGEARGVGHGDSPARSQDHASGYGSDRGPHHNPHSSPSPHKIPERQPNRHHEHQPERRGR